MYKTLTIDGKEMGFAANAATPFRFQQIFHKDLLGTFANEERAQREGVEVVTELAYIMAMQAQKADMARLTYDGFIEWLEQFEPMAFIETSEEIMGVYMESAKANSEP